MELRFSSKAINEIEGHFGGKSIPEIVGGVVDTKTRAFLVRKGLELKTEDESFEAMDKYYEENPGKDSLDLQFLIMDVLEKQGFLAKELTVPQIVKELLASGKKNLQKEIELLENTGEAEKAKQ